MSGTQLTTPMKQRINELLSKRITKKLPSIPQLNQRSKDTTKNQLKTNNEEQTNKNNNNTKTENKLKNSETKETKKNETKPELPKRRHTIKKNKKPSFPLVIKKNKTKDVQRIQNVFRGYLKRKTIFDSAKFKKPIERICLITEIISTEKTYVQQLKIIIDEFLIPLKKTKIIDPNEIKNIFSNIESIYGLNHRLYLDLEKRKSNLETRQWFDLFTRFIPFLKLYTDFVNNYENALETIRKNIQNNNSFATFLEQTHQSEKLQGFKIFDLLITPVQRIPRYVLLIQGVIKNTDQNHPEYQEFKKILERLRHIADHVNKTKFVTNNFRKLVNLEIKLKNSDENLEIISRRRLVKEDHFFEKDNPNREKSWGILFNDIFVIATKIEEGKFLSREVLSLDEILVKQIGSFFGESNSIIISRGLDNYQFISDNPRHKKQWLEALTQTVQEYKQELLSNRDCIHWKEMPTTGENLPTCSFSQVCFNNDSLYFLGDKNSEEFELYCLDTKNWNCSIIKESIGNKPVPRTGFSLSIIDDNLYIFGGKNQNEEFNDLRIYSISKNTWIDEQEIIGIPPTKRYGHSASVISDQLWIFGGKSENIFFNDLYCFITSSLTWYSLEVSGTLPAPRYFNSASFISDQLIIFGGQSKEVINNDVWVYDLPSEQWYEADVEGQIPSPRYQHKCVVINDRLWFFGGKTKKEKSETIAILDLETARWEYIREEGNIPKLNMICHSVLFDEESEMILTINFENDPKPIWKVYKVDTIHKKGVKKMNSQILPINDENENKNENGNGNENENENGNENENESQNRKEKEKEKENKKENKNESNNTSNGNDMNDQDEENNEDNINKKKIYTIHKSYQRLLTQELFQKIDSMEKNKKKTINESPIKEKNIHENKNLNEIKKKQIDHTKSNKGGDIVKNEDENKNGNGNRKSDNINNNKNINGNNNNNNNNKNNNISKSNNMNKNKTNNNNNKNKNDENKEIENETNKFESKKKILEKLLSQKNNFIFPINNPNVLKEKEENTNFNNKRTRIVKSGSYINIEENKQKKNRTFGRFRSDTRKSSIKEKTKSVELKHTFTLTKKENSLLPLKNNDLPKKNESENLNKKKFRIGMFRKIKKSDEK
ncbi:faciogenital dysplasia protein [Anaeramoeba flamelloides]|uniref:Faciogenital dysplasia protein n=1 Tax=Anaeramoeba flamelloides TaxID=1746091 RepID=A0AAV8AD21_9EUKA|nr:faciogenital dysplasia protein [Anaeramoeba flamelloides]